MIDILLTTTSVDTRSDTRLDLQRATLKITAIILFHDLLSHLLSLEVDEAIRRIPSSHRVDRNVDGLDTSKNILEQLLNILGRRLVRHVPNIQPATFINGLFCLYICQHLAFRSLRRLT